MSQSPPMRTALRHLLLIAATVELCSCGDPKEHSTSAPPSRNLDPVEGTIESRPLPQREALDADQTLFQRLDASHTGIDYGFHWEDPASRLKEFLFLNPSGGICTGDYDGDGLPDVYITSPSGGNRLYRNLGNFKFVDATKAAGVSDEHFWGSGASFVDIDNDGDLDLYACGYTRANKLYINDGSGKFTDRAAEFGLDFNGGSMMMSFADIDNDGDLDGYLATTAVAPPPGTKFRVNYVPRESDGVEVPVVIPELREYWEILYLPGDKVRRVEAGQYDRLFRNDGGKFVEVSKAAGIEGAYFSLSAIWFDYDQDGDPDLYVSNDYTGPDYLYRNRGDGTFDNVISESVPHTPWFSMGSDVGDLNNDGLPDLIASDMSATSHYREKVMMGNMEDSAWFLDTAEPRQYMRNALYLNSGSGRFHEAAFLAGLSSSDWTWTPRIEDFDQDGLADVFITNGIMRDNMNSDLTRFANQHLKAGTPEYVKFWIEKPMHKEDNLAFRNLGDLKFKSVGPDWGLQYNSVSFGAATADFDNDGDPDLVVTNSGEPVSLYRNDSSDHHRIAVQLVGRASNHRGLGATILVTTAADTQTRVVTSARGWLSASDTTALFGLGEHERIDHLEVRWPGGTRQVFKNLEADQFYIVSEPVGQTPPSSPPSVDPMFVGSGNLAIAAHTEIPYNDFQRQPLLPNKLSQQGPGIAWGDIDGDGDEDVFLGGSKDHPGQLFLNSGAGQFTSHPSASIAADAASEDLGALFFDCDGDGDLDLYVTHGGVEAPPNAPYYQDRLYLNDGKGSFSPAPTDALPELRHSSTAVTAADFDRDGDLDLFVGGRVVPGQYPVAPPSSLLINTDGKFSPTEIPNLGMVTSAIVSDPDHDGWVDLLVTTDWGPVRFLKNENGVLVDRTAETGLDQLTGWWNGIAAGDVDADGDLDYLVTNNGLNSKYKASPEKPELIFYGDVDGSGKPHLIEAKMSDGKLLPRRGFSCSKNAMPSLQTKVGSFHKFAISGLTDLYSESRLGNALRLEANTLESGLLINDGEANFSWSPLPRFAQIAPAFGAALIDLDADGDLDAVLAQNSFSPQRETGRMDGGLGLALLNDGSGAFSILSAPESGLVIPGDAKSLTVSDLDSDGRPDLAFGMNNAQVITYLNRTEGKPLEIRLIAGPGNSTGIGARVTIGKHTRERQSTGGYLSQSSGALYFPASTEGREAIVIWADGTRTQHPISPGANNAKLVKPEG